ncbi:MAG: hypothetical protein IAE95_10585 [Chitinophagaceae bacterium]|nr:hypothetical protein [Chitinophagaceae bacterium]
MAVVVASVAAASISSYFAQKMFTPRPPSFEKALVAAANEMNKMCPMMVDQSTRLDNTMVMPGNAFQYNYTIIDVEKAEVKLDTVRKYLEPVIIANVKNNSDMKLQREHKTTLIYKYKDKNGLEIYTLKVTPDMYQ